MKIKSSIFTLALTSVLAIAGCTEQLGDNSSELNGGVPFSFSASASGSKTSVEGLQTVWDADDKVNLFHAEAGEVTYSNDNDFVISSQNLSANTFTGTLTKALDPGKAYDWYVLYPYSTYNKTPAGTNKDNCSYITIGGISQTQNGNNSLAHLSGKSCPLFGVAKSVPASDRLSLTMRHLTSIVEVNVTNNSGSALQVNSVAFTAPEKVAGTYYIDCSDPENIEYAPTSDTFVSTSATLTVKNGDEIADGDNAKFYIAIKPFTASAGSELKVSVNGAEQIYPIESAVTFNPGKIKKISFNYAKAEEAVGLPYSEPFSASQGKFTTNDVTMPSPLTYVWTWDSKYGMKASAFVNNTAYATESWLVSPLIDLGDAGSAFLSFDHACNKFTSIETAKEETSVRIRIQGGDWETLENVNYPTSLGWDFVNSGSIDLAAYVGNIVQIAFVYTSTTTKAGTWEIKNVLVQEASDEPVVLESISWSGYTSNYTVGSTFKADGTVTATYSDGSTLNVSSEASFSTPDMSTAGTKTVTVTYQGKATTGTITVEAAAELATFTAINDISKLQDGSLLLIVAKNGDKYYQLPCNPTVTSGKVSGVEVTVTDNTIKALGTDAWTATKSGEFWLLSSGGKYIYHSNGGSSGTNLTYGTSTNYPWSISNHDSAEYTFKLAGVASETVNSRGMLMNATKFGGYSLTNIDATDYSAIMLFVKGGDQSDTPLIIVDDITSVPARGVSAGTSTYSIENPVAGTAIAAKCDGTVVTSVNVADGSLTYAVSANKTTAARSGSITLTYGSVTKVVNVSQLAPAFKVSRTSVELEADADASSSITVTSDFSWTAASSSGAGFEFSPASCTWTDANYTDGKTTVTISAKAANASEDGTKTLGTLTFTNAETSQALEVTVTQKSSYVAPGTGTDVTFTMTTDGDFSGGVTTATKDVITLTGGQGSYTSNINVGSTYTKVYAGNTLTLSATTGTKITKVVFTATSSYIKTWTADDATECVVKSSDNTMTWENADGVNTVTFTNTAAGQARIKTVVVTYN